MATEPNKTLLDDPKVPRIRLDETEWPVPKLAPKQNEVVVPLILRVLPKVMKTMQAPRASDGEPVDPAIARATVQLNLKLLGEALDEQGMKDLSTITFVALTRGHPTLTRDEFEDMPCGTLDLVEAVMTIAKQTGVIRPAAQGDKPLGEAQAA